MSNEQPLIADLYDMPSAGDAGLVCTNVRSLDGKRPVFVDQMSSTFFFPYHIVRFLEIPESEMASYDATGPGVAPRATREPRTGNGHDADTEPGAYLPVAIGGPQPVGEDDPDLELEIDEGFLQRIRDI